MNITKEKNMAAVHALTFDQTGDPAEALALTEVVVPPPGPGQVTIAMEASPIDPTDLAFVRGRYVPPKLPASSAGQSGVGRVAAVGDGVDESRLGDRVVVIPSGRRHVWQERLNVDEGDVVTVDGDADPLQLAAVGTNLATAYLLLGQAPTSAGDWIAQTAANSAVGRAVTALAAHRGLRTINVVRRPEAVPLVGDRGDVTLVSDEGFESRLADALGADRLGLVLAATGGPAVTALIAGLRRGGRAVSYGRLDGEPLTLPNMILGNLHVDGFWITNWIADAEQAEIEETYRAVAGLVAEGVLTTEIASTYPLGDFAAAVEVASLPSTTGKVVFTFDR